MNARWCHLALLFLIAIVVPPASCPAHASDNDTCLGCHADASLTTERRGRTVSLHVDAQAFGRSSHAGLGCLDCHSGIDPENLPHRARRRPVDCRPCHADPAASHRFHAAFAAPAGAAENPAVACAGCHGAHDITAPAAPEGKFGPARLIASCGSCHQEVAREFLDSEHGRAVAAGQPGAPSCLACHDRPLTHARNGGDPVAHKEKQEAICLSCHLDDPEVRARMSPDAGFISAYEGSVHGRALLGGNAAAANCVDCHGAHQMRKGFDAGSRVSHQHIPGTCGTCHSAIEKEYAASVHGAAFARGIAEAPVCTDCHGEHDILSPGNPDSPVAPGNVSARVCSPCHSSVRLSEKYGIASDRFRTFSDSYHGLAIRGGDLAAANCASCHGAHDIRPSSDPASSINAANLSRTCGKCHPGANQRFAEGSVHLVMNGRENPILYWVATTYVILIVVTVGGMFLHNLLDFLRKAGRRLRARRGGTPHAAHAQGQALYLRMTRGERLQHGLLVVSFTLLVVTGFMLHYPDAWWVVSLRRLSDHLFELRSLLHRAAGVVMVLASVCHVVYLGATARGRRLLRDLLPRREDLYDPFRLVAYNLGLRSEKPLFGRFSYLEKVEYWALVWGTALMTLTGVILWFEDTFIGLLSKLGWDVARTIHFYEAWLATLAILVWHIYFVIFNPDVYSMNMAWIKGTLSEEEMAEEHPLELQELRAGEPRVGPGGPAGRKEFRGTGGHER